MQTKRLDFAYGKRGDVQSQGVEAVGLVAGGESQGSRRIAGQAAAVDGSIAVGHGGVVQHAPLLRQLKIVHIQHSLDRIGEPVVDIEPERPEPVAEPPAGA